jgi:hypothetical protein
MTTPIKCCVLACGRHHINGIPINEIGVLNAPATWKATTAFGNSEFYTCDDCKKYLEDPKHKIRFERLSPEPDTDFSDVW